MTKTGVESRVEGRLWIDKGEGGFLGRGRVELLAAIAEHGSISAAARALGLSYKAAWDRVDAMNNLADTPLVVREAGGRHGGGTRLTEEGKRLIEVYRALDQEYSRCLDRLNAGLANPDHLPSLLSRFAVRTSARNQWAGRVTGVRHGPVNTVVEVALDDGVSLNAVVTRESVDALGIANGKGVFALVKANFVALTPEQDRSGSLDNRWCARVSHILRGPRESEVSLETPGGRSIVAVVTTPALDSLGLREGERACAAFEASDVILAVSE